MKWRARITANRYAFRRLAIISHFSQNRPIIFLHTAHQRKCRRLPTFDSRYDKQRNVTRELPSRHAKNRNILAHSAQAWCWRWRLAEAGISSPTAGGSSKCEPAISSLMASLICLKTSGPCPGNINMALNTRQNHSSINFKGVGGRRKCACLLIDEAAVKLRKYNRMKCCHADVCLYQRKRWLDFIDSAIRLGGIASGEGLLRYDVFIIAELPLSADAGRRRHFAGLLLIERPPTPPAARWGRASPPRSPSMLQQHASDRHSAPAQLVVFRFRLSMHAADDKNAFKWRHR